MRNKNLFENENVKLRLINLEYSYKERFASENTNEVKKAKEDFVADVRRIYKEETNKELPKNIKIYTSKEILQNKDSSVKRSGYDGTAIYIQDKTHDTNQLQIISQGSADNEDWVYNFSGLFLGMDDSQYKATKEFTIETKKKTQDVKSLNTYAMGHSLANNNQVLVQLVDGEFDEVYGVNGAQISVDHILKADYKLTNYLKRKFSTIKISEIPKNDLKKAIIKYYNDKGVTANITQRISSDDPLYGVSGKADFITFGDMKMTNTHPDIKGFRSVIDHIPDEDVSKLKGYFQKYAADYRKGGIQGFTMEAIGVDMDFLNGIMNEEGTAQQIAYCLKHPARLLNMVGALDKKLPEFKAFFAKVKAYSGPVLNQLEANGYIDEAKKKTIQKDIAEVERLTGRLDVLYEEIKFLVDWKTVIFTLNNRQLSQSLMKNLIEFYSTYKALEEALGKLDQDTKDLLNLIGEGHSITPLLNALSKKKGISYKGGDIYFSKKGKDGKEIKVNLSSAIRIYQAGMAAISKIEAEIERYQRIFHHEIHDHFAIKKSELTKAIHDMEANPSRYQFDIQFKLASGFAGSNGKLNKIVVHDSYHTAPLPQCDGVVSELKKQTSSKKKFVKSIRASIEKLFDEDEQISALFDFKA
ncbi:DUF6792 domain-containing protein [Bacillus sp. GM2]|uniref:DUF6792 domain-containing protein n=1 Tax=Bacillus TaxID=1386 RepID=UPI0007414A09|nr:DUF6792 domain-containing protein [Bacillus paralicheniformis]KUL18658.1 hypothetical protein LI6934_04960 [Bacillus licheniformis LMG 6934]KAA0836771.1 hypothetical protein EI979_14535 [Bacillus paralicheniformis]KAA0839423.1 hypothetical protein EI977_11855 [Bacillus paralicheniformis]OLG08523.1 hypothetical protein B4123_3683 [Bacillus paralicheniformis]TAI51445.1 hypothetical protein CXP52_15060 [Bacillus paralicheniformis]